jgi:hypothetical protein
MSNFSSESKIILDSKKFNPNSSSELNLRHKNISLCATSASGKSLVVVSSSSTNSLVVSIFSKTSEGWISTLSQNCNLPKKRDSIHQQPQQNTQIQNVTTSRSDDERQVQGDALDDLRNLLLLGPKKSSTAVSNSNKNNNNDDEKIHLRSVKISEKDGSILVHFTRSSSKSEDQLCILKNFICCVKDDDDDEEEYVEPSINLLSDSSLSLNRFSDFCSCGDFVFLVDPRDGVFVGSISSSKIICRLQSISNCSMISCTTNIHEGSTIINLVCFEATGGGFTILEFSNSSILKIVKRVLGVSVVDRFPLAASFIPSVAHKINDSIQICCGWARSEGIDVRNEMRRKATANELIKIVGKNDENEVDLGVVEEITTEVKISNNAATPCWNQALVRDYEYNSAISFAQNLPQLISGRHEGEESMFSAVIQSASSNEFALLVVNVKSGSVNFISVPTVKKNSLSAGKFIPEVAPQVFCVSSKIQIVVPLTSPTNVVSILDFEINGDNEMSAKFNGVSKEIIDNQNLFQEVEKTNSPSFLISGMTVIPESASLFVLISKISKHDQRERIVSFQQHSNLIEIQLPKIDLRKEKEETKDKISSSSDEASGLSEMLKKLLDESFLEFGKKIDGRLQSIEKRLTSIEQQMGKK